MKRMGAVESDSVKSARKAKDKLHKACERASETREWTLHGQEQNNAHGKHERVTRQWSISSQHTSTITCTAAPRVWHFSAFHCYGNERLSWIIELYVAQWTSNQRSECFDLRIFISGITRTIVTHGYIQVMRYIQPHTQLPVFLSALNYNFLLQMLWCRQLQVFSEESSH